MTSKVPEGRPTFSRTPFEGQLTTFDSSRALTQSFNRKSSRHDPRSFRSQNCVAERGRDPSRFVKPRELPVSPTALRAYGERHFVSGFDYGRLGLQNCPQPSVPARCSERLSENDTQRVTRQHATDVQIFQFDRRCNFRRRRPPRLFTRLTNNTLPAFPALHSRTGQMSIRPPGDYRDDASDPDFRAFLDRPFHAVEFEDGESQRDLRGARPSPKVLLRAERELNAIIGDRSNCPAADFFAGCNIKLLPNLGAQDASKMRSMVAHQSGSVSRYFVGDPAAACHESGVRSQVSGLRKNLIIEDKGNKPDPCHLTPALHKHVLHPSQQRPPLRLVFHRRQFSQFGQQFALAFAQFPGCLYSHLNEEIAFAVPIQHRHAFVPDAKRGSGLRALRDFQLMFSLQRRNHNLRAHGSLRKRNRNHAV